MTAVRAAHVVIVHVAYAIGGAERTTLHVLKALRARKDPGMSLWRITVVAPAAMESYFGAEADDFYNSDELGLAGWFDTRERLFADAAAMGGLLRELDADVVLSSMHYVTAVAARAAAVVERRPVLLASWRGPVFEHLNTYESEDRRQWISGELGRAIQWMGGVTVPGAGTAQELLDRSLIAPEKLWVIPNGIDRGDAEARAAASVCLPCGVERKRFFIVLARLSAEKEIERILRAYAMTRSRRNGLHRWSLVLVGDGPERDALEVQATALGVAESVSVVGASSDPEAWLANAGALVHTCRYEGFGYSMLEAMAIGTPVIATDCPYGPREVLGDAGVLVPLGDDDALATAMLRVEEHSAERAALRARGLERANAFPLSICRERHAAFVSEALSHADRWVEKGR